MCNGDVMVESVSLSQTDQFEKTLFFHGESDHTEREVDIMSGKPRC